MRFAEGEGAGALAGLGADVRMRCGRALRLPARACTAREGRERLPRKASAQGAADPSRGSAARPVCGKERVRLVLRGEEHLKRHLLDLVLQLLELVDVLVLVFEDVHEDVARGVVEHFAG